MGCARSLRLTHTGLGTSWVFWKRGEMPERARNWGTIGSGVHTLDQLLISCVAVGRGHAMSLPVSLSVKWA